MSAENFLDIPEKNVTIAAIEYGYFNQQLERLGDSAFRNHLDEMHFGCFASKYAAMDFPETASGFIYFVTNRILDDSEKKTMFLVPELVETIMGMTIVGIYGDYADLWAVCATVYGQSRGAARIIIQTVLNNPSLEMVDIYVLYDNPYWARALGLYTSLQFGEPESAVGGRSMSRFPSEALKLTWARGYTIDKKGVRKEANDIREAFYTGQGFIVNRLEMPVAHLLQLERIAADQTREYGGGIGVERIGGEGNVNVYRSVNISNPIVGGFIAKEATAAGVRASPTIPLYHFHTHPDSIAEILDVITAPPSAPDLSLCFYWLGQGTFRQFVIESQETGGIWTFQVNPHVAKLICGTGSPEYFEQMFEPLQAHIETIVGAFFGRLAELRQLTPSGTVRRSALDMEIIKSDLINQYIKDVNMIQYSDTGLRLFTLEYHSWKYILSNDTFVDWTIMPQPRGACAKVGELASQTGLRFGYDYEDLRPILDAIDFVGNREYTTCALAQNSGYTRERAVDEGLCGDRWEGQELIPVLKAAAIVGVQDAVDAIRSGQTVQLDKVIRVEEDVDEVEENYEDYVSNLALDI